MAAQNFPAAPLCAGAARSGRLAQHAARRSRQQASRNLAKTDLGAAPAGERLGRMLFLLAPPAAQQQALTTELANLQNPASPPITNGFLRQSSPPLRKLRSDVSAVQAWLESESFTVAPLPAGRGWIEFSGTVAQVERAFHTQIHTVTTAGEARSVLAGGISVPSALSPLVQGLVSLDGALATPALTTPQPVSHCGRSLRRRPLRVPRRL